ncbi:hypothetical protein [Mucilaginibacter sp.]
MNISGLALGLATCMLIVFYVIDELSYDRYNTKAKAALVNPINSLQSE